MIKLQKAKWIWADIKPEKDTYADFTDHFYYDGNTPLEIAISADSEYTLWINGRLAGFGQYTDYPSYKVGDLIDITEYAVKGINHLAVTVWYLGNNCFTYIPGNAGLLYEVRTQDKVLAFSDPSTLSRLSPAYVCGECINISPQLGYTYHFNNQTNDRFQEGGELQGFAPSREVTGITYELHKRPIKRMILDPRSPAKTVQQGFFAYTTRTGHLGQDMQRAALSPLPMQEMTGADGQTLSADGGDGIYLILDLGEEQVGFLELDIELPCACRVDVGYGEHLADGRCRTGIRNFTCAVEAKEGRNQYLNTFRRFGCRYLQFFIHAPRVKIFYLGLRQTRYPLTHKRFESGNLLRDTIYRVCQHTLECCMHVHYEDCPWREQALYTLDSRNQMLCGYDAFGETEFARASLRLIANGLRPDGLLSLCYPAGDDLPIPAFSLAYFLQMNEYIAYTHDLSLARECYPVLERLIQTFAAKYEPCGLIGSFYDDTGSYWNFYEWAPTMDGRPRATQCHIEAPLNAFYSLALQNLAQICTALDRHKDAVRYTNEAKQINLAIAKHFFEENTGLFRSFLDDGQTAYSVLTNALCLLCGAADSLADKKTLLRVLCANGSAGTGLTIHPNTLSMNGFRFDALLREDTEAYRQTILNEIDETYLRMLQCGATTFWETALGEADFHMAGSLCHGWSALPIHYYETLLQHS